MGDLRFAICDLRLRGCLLVLGGVWLLLCPPALALDEDAMPAGVENSVNKGLAFLVKQQGQEGWFDGGTASKVSTTSRALLAFLGSGNVPDTGRYGLNVHDAVEWLLAQQASDGYFGETQRGMRGHALATLALAEAYGVDVNPDRRLRIRTALDKAVAVILAAQAVPKANPSFAGGWNAERSSTDSSLSATANQLLALRACQDVGLSVPAQALKSAAEFVLRCHDARAGGFGPAPLKPAQVSSTAAGITCLRLLNVASQHSAEIDSAVKYLMSHPIDAGTPFGYPSLSIVTLCTYETGGDAWSRVGRGILGRLTTSQEKDGGWPEAKAGPNGRPLNRTAATAVALQTLTIPYQLLPIYQR